MKTAFASKFLQFLFLPLFVFMLNVGWGQTTILTQNFGTTNASLPAGWTSSNTTNGWNGSTASPSSTYTGFSAGANALFAGTGTNGTTHTLTYSNSFSTIGYNSITVLWGGRGTSTFNGTITFQWSSNGTTWNNVSYSYTVAGNAWALVNSGTRISLPAGAAGISNLMFRWSSSSTNTGNYRIDDFTVQGTAAAPTIIGSATTTAFTTTFGTASSAQTFSVSGSNLTADLVATAPTGYEVSSDGTNYGSTATFTQTSGSASGSLRIRLAASATVGGAYNSQTIVLSSTGATIVNITTAASGNAVSAKALTITGLSAANKNYDGSTTVSVTGTAAYSGLVNSESFTPSDVVTWAFPDANVGTNKVLTRTGTYSNPSSNYTLTQPSLTANISAVVSSAPTITSIAAGNAQLSVAFTAPSSNGGSSITNYEYSTNNGVSFTAFSPVQTSTPLVISSLTNGTTYDVQIRAVNSAGNGTASNMIQGTPVAPASPTITASLSTFASAFSTTYGTASASQSFSLSGAALTGDLTLTAPTGFEISLSNSTGYAASLNLVQSSGAVASITIYARIAATSAAGSYNNSLLSVSGGGATTVTIASTISNNTVAQKALTITGLSASNKSYDGNTSATLSGTATYSGLTNSETFATVGSATATFASANVANGIAVTVTGFSAPSANYSITQPSFTANITAVNVTISGISIANKTYDNSTTATVTGTAAYQGTLNNESFAVTGTPAAVFASVNVGTSISVTVTGYTAPSANYTITQPTGLTANITAANQTITFNALTNQTTATVVDYTPGATSATSAVNAITYTSSNAAVATIVGGLIHIVGAGTTAITASQAGNENYNAAASVSQNLVVTLTPVVLGAWQFGNPASLGSETTFNATTIAGNLNTITLTRGAGIASTALGRGFASNGWDANATKANAISNNEYFEFVISSITNYNFSISTLNATLRRSGTTAPSAYIWKYSLDGVSFSDIGTDVSFTSTADGAAQSQISLSGISALQNAKTATFRLYAWGGTSTTATFSIGRFATGVTSNSLAIGGNVFADLLPPTLTADATANTVDNNIDITHTADAAWTSAITAVKIGGTSLTPTTDYAISAGNIQLKPSGGNALLTTSGTKSITVVAAGYTDATVSQVINAGAPTSNSTATINSILASGATRTITCTAKDQYSNLVSGYAFKYDATVVNTTLVISESYSIEGSAITSTTNDVSLTATTNASGIATFDVQMPSLMDANDGISIQVQLANGSTNIGSAFAYYELPGQTITFNALTPVTYGDVAFTLSAFGGASGNPVVFTSSNNAVATCTGTNGTTVTIIGVGTVSISANQAGNAGYNAAAPVSQTLTVNQKALTISGITGVTRSYNGTTAATFTGIPAYVGLVNGQSFSVSGTATAAFSDANAGTGKTITVTGYAAPSDNYSLTQPTLTADITQASQTITGFASLPNRAVGGPTFTLTQNATSGLAITYTSSNTSVATIVGNTVTLVGAGTTTITASQAGNVNYSAATSVAQIQTIIALPIAAWDFYGQTSPTSFAATTFNTNLDATSSLSAITRGAGAVVQSTPPGSSFSTTGFQNDGISTSNTDYFQVTMKAKSGYLLSLSEINANFDGTASFYANTGVTSQYAYSIDGTNFTLIGNPVTSTSLKPAAVDLTGVSALQSLPATTTVTIRYYASGQTTTGGWRFSSPAAGVPGLAVGGSLCLVPTTPIISSTTFCVVGETGSISTTTSELNVNYELYDSNGVVPNSMKSGTGNALTWSNVTDGNYYVVATNPLGDCSSTSATLNVAGTVAAYPYYLDSDSDGYGTGTALQGCVSTAPAGYSLNTGDCNNSNSAYYPTAVEICGNGIDENCSGPSDDAPISYRSVTSGNWGDASTWEMACYAGSAYTAATYAPVSSFTGITTIQNTHVIVIPNNGTVYQTGTLDVDAGGTLTMTGNDYNNDPTTANVSAVAKLTVTLVIINDGTMNVGHQASLVQTATTAGTVNSGSGNFNVQSKLTGNWSSPTGAPNGRYWYIGSPMNNTVASQFYDTPSMVRLWSYNGTNNSWGIVIHSQTSTTSSLKLVPGIGYLYRAGANKTITYTSTAANLNNNITTNLLAPASDASYVPVLGYSTIGYKYVANPYPSHVDWTLLSRTGLNAGYWIRNSTNTSYDAYNATTQLGSSSSGQTTKYIAPMQGFWVYAYTTPCALRIDNTDRVHSTNVLHAPTVNQVVRLKLNNGESSDYTVVYENELAANDFEETDTDKMFDYDFHQLYTLEGEHELVLNGLSNATSKGSVDMGISVANNGQYTIEATDLEMEEDVILEDRFNHTFQDLKVNPIYSFTSQAGTFNERFVLHFTNTESVAVGETETVVDEVRVFNTSNKQVKVWVSNTAEYKGATVKVYDAIGNLVERKNMTSNELLLDLDIANGIYVVEVTGAEKVFTKKIFLSK